MNLKELKKELQCLKNPAQAKLLQGFFKTGPGQYGEGDIFLGIKVPVQRGIAKKYLDLELKDIQQLLNSKIHEYRLIGLLILTYQYDMLEKKPSKKNREEEQKKIFDFYLKNTKKINNWDLVDVTAPRIVGKYLLDKKNERQMLYKLAKSDNLWEKRISIISTLTFIVNKEHKDALAIAKILLYDKHDLIHKAVGWMLREVGKRISEEIEEKFLKKHYKQMPRTMLRYAIERFEEKKRLKYLVK